MIIKMTEDKELVITIPTTLYRGEKKADQIRFLIPAEYEDVNVADCSMLMRYILPNGKGRSEALAYLPEMYKGYLQFSTVVNTRLTAETGDITIWLTAINNNDDVVLKTGEVLVEIQPSKNIADYFDVDDMDELDALSARIDMLDKTKADNIICNADEQEIQLTSNGELIGNAIDLGDIQGISNDVIHFDQDASDDGEGSDTSDNDDVIHF